MVVAATLWSIWLARNEAIFQCNRILKANLENIIFIRVAKWDKASKVLNFYNDALWKLNPLGALTLHSQSCSQAYWSHKFGSFDYICVVDGAWGYNSFGSFS